MLRLYQPCLPTRSIKAPTGPLCIHEIKHDGFRIVARRIGAVVRLQTKQGHDYAERYPLIVEAISRLKVTSIVIDGEAMCFSGAMHDFDKLWNRTHDHEAKLCAFDLLELDGEDYRSKPLTERKKMLFKLLRRAWRGIEYVEHLEGDGSLIFGENSRWLHVSLANRLTFVDCIARVVSNRASTSHGIGLSTAGPTRTSMCGPRALQLYLNSASGRGGR